MAYNARIVPLLFDISSEYTSILPNSSYVSLHSYDTPELLAKDIVQLREDAATYNKHFKLGY